MNEDAVKPCRLCGKPFEEVYPYDWEGCCKECFERETRVEQYLYQSDNQPST